MAVIKNPIPTAEVTHVLEQEVSSRVKYWVARATSRIYNRKLQKSFRRFRRELDLYTGTALTLATPNEAIRTGAARRTTQQHSGSGS